jgi:protease II
VLVFTEDDQRYEVTVRASTKVVQPRRRGIDYQCDHGGGELFLVTNDGATEFRLMRAPAATSDNTHWTEVAAARRRHRGSGPHRHARALRGLLQGAVLSLRPDRWRALVAEVPYVDVVNTMLDPSIPLTVNERDEWGDPRLEADFAVLRSYSPYDTVPPAPPARRFSSPPRYTIRG